ncbi:phosphotransferase family protein [Amycolatopsis pithecellobii]|uniref:phosphotransferase family protein n=1 Tax=Amycolatopsis pithecellobii TaxID=664692 RepID=UPI001FE84DE3|nr:aminoglycoside phosphotransferase family protein [Amycolatopsis pithecellobii]
MTEETAHRTLVAVCRRVGFDPAGAELIRIGSNAVYRLAKPVIVRIARDGETAGNARKQVAVARWLAAENYPATRALDVDQPIELGGHVTTLWESASEEEEYAPLAQVAELIRRLHELDAPPSLALPQIEPFAKLDGYMPDLERVDRSDAAFIRQRIEHLQGRYEELDFALKPGVIHGDANVGNVILDRDGNPLLIDLDSFCVGPREWDLVQTALFYERFGWHTEDEYRQFVDIYGFDIMSWPGYPVLAEYREISMTLWLSQKAVSDEGAANEVHKRIEAIRTGGSRRDWAPF